MKRVALLGMPNTGKSTFFNRLTGAGARVGNWPGITVDLMSAKVLLGGSMVEVVDLPGVYNLHGFSEDEKVVRRFLESQPVNLLIVVLNATQLDRQLALALQVKQLGVPLLVMLNMADEARHLGIHVDLPRLEQALGGQVRMMSAKFGTHFAEAKQLLQDLLHTHDSLTRVDPAAFGQDHHIEQELDHLVSQTVQTPIQLPPTVTDRLDRLMLHPLLGIPLFFLVMFLMFQLVYGLGTPLQDSLQWLFGHIKEIAVNPAVAGLPEVVQSFLSEGLYDGLGTVLTFMPVIALFFLAMALVEDSGYLARVAFLTDAIMSRVGLDGRAFVMQVMGFGCNVPAIMGTRIMHSKALRALTMLVIPFSLCSARLQVFLFITTAIFSPTAAPFVLLSLYLLSFFFALLTALVWRRRFVSHEPLLLELPPYRVPTGKYLFHESWRATMQFLRGAGGFIVLGVVLVWFLTHYPFGSVHAGPETLAGRMADWLSPIFTPLALDNLLAIALLFGFVAKEIVIGALAVIYNAGAADLQQTLAGRLDWVQGYSFLLFILVYTPCLSTIATIRQESRSWLVTLLSVAWPLSLAWAVSFLFVQTARALGY